VFSTNHYQMLVVVVWQLVVVLTSFVELIVVVEMLILGAVECMENQEEAN